MTSAQISAVIISGIMLFSCQFANTNTKTEPTPEPSKNMVGNDKDEHGCKASAGFTWSDLKQECVRIFESGTAFKAFGKNTDNTLAAYVIISDDKTKAEVYIPNMASSVLLEKVNSTDSNLPKTLYINNKDQIKLTLTDQGYFIEIKGEALYFQAILTDEGMNKLVSPRD